MANQEWCDWKFQIYCNKFEWVNPRSRDEKKSILCVFKRIVFKDNNKPSRWLVHSKLGSLEINEFLKKAPNFYEK